MTTAIIVDSAAAMPEELAQELGILIVPMRVIVDGRSYFDGELSADELLSMLDEREVSTSGPSPGEWASAIDKALVEADEALVFTVSSEMSTTYRSAQLGAELTERPVRVVDTRSAAGGEALVAMAAAERAAIGETADEIVRAIEAVVAEVQLVATVDNLDRVVRSGRVPDIAGAAVHALRVNPLFEFRHGRARPMHPAIGRRAAEHRIVRSCLTSRPRGASSVLHAAVLEAACPDRGRSLLRALREEEPDASVIVAPFGSVMLANVGGGVVGLAWWWEIESMAAGGTSATR
jgi:DegV family protein with EDD domain